MKGLLMYWINTIAELLGVPVETARAVYERMYCFDFSEASTEELRTEARIALLCMKAR
jgi:hypothetical protein